MFPLHHVNIAMTSTSRKYELQGIRYVQGIVEDCGCAFQEFAPKTILVMTVISSLEMALRSVMLFTRKSKAVRVIRTATGIKFQPYNGIWCIGAKLSIKLLALFMMSN